MLGDFNEDGKIDVITSAPEGTRLGFVFYAGLGDGTFAVPQNVGSGKVYSIATADLNGDGHLDIIGVDEALAQLDVNLGNGDGTFQAARRWLQYRHRLQRGDRKLRQRRGTGCRRARRRLEPAHF